jgi:translation initiation factor 2B subunit (eIF-2B alpha/beta/delta family)
MDERSVVTCLLRNDGQILLFRRSDDVGSYPGQWGTVTGHLGPERDAPPDDPETAARREIREETDLEDAVTLVRVGEPFDVEDAERGTRWHVTPLLFDCVSREVDPNWETESWEWVYPPEIRERETVPDLWTSYDRVRPTIESIATDRDHGSAWLSVRALEVLRDEAALATEWGDVAAVARQLRAVRPSMTVIENRINRAMTSAAERSPATVETAARVGIESAVIADREAAMIAAERVAGQRVCTLSRSGTVLETLDRADPEAVLVAESRPGGEGVTVAESLATEHDVTLTSDAALASQLAEWGADTVLVGADTALPDGSVLNKVGTRGLALAAAHEDVPVYVVAAADKISPDTDVEIERSTETLYDGNAPLDVANPLFDVTPVDLVTGICTEEGILETGDVTAIADRHCANRDW